MADCILRPRLVSKLRRLPRVVFLHLALYAHVETLIPGFAISNSQQINTRALRLAVFAPASMVISACFVYLRAQILI
jgi:hypothetical protein